MNPDHELQGRVRLTEYVVHGIVVIHPALTVYEILQIPVEHVVRKLLTAGQRGAIVALQLLEIATDESCHVLRVRRGEIGQFVIQPSIPHIVEHADRRQDFGFADQELHEHALEEDVDAQWAEIPGMNDQQATEREERA